jgi:uncharacterized membrane protein YesL
MKLKRGQLLLTLEYNLLLDMYGIIIIPIKLLNMVISFISHFPFLFALKSYCMHEIRLCHKNMIQIVSQPFKSIDSVIKLVATEGVLMLLLI